MGCFELSGFGELIRGEHEEISNVKQNNRNPENKKYRLFILVF